MRCSPPRSSCPAQVRCFAVGAVLFPVGFAASDTCRAAHARRRCAGCWFDLWLAQSSRVGLKQWTVWSAALLMRAGAMPCNGQIGCGCDAVPPLLQYRPSSCLPHSLTGAHSPAPTCPLCRLVTCSTERLLRHLHAHGIPVCLATSSHLRHYSLKTTLHGDLFALFNHRVTGWWAGATWARLLSPCICGVYRCAGLQCPSHASMSLGADRPELPTHPLLPLQATKSATASRPPTYFCKPPRCGSRHPTQPAAWCSRMRLAGCRRPRRRACESGCVEDSVWYSKMWLTGHGSEPGLIWVSGPDRKGSLCRCAGFE